VGLLGAGGIGETHLEALRRVGGVDVVALCDINEKACRAYADRHGVRRVYADWRQLVDDVEVEVVEICTPNYHHYPQIMYALERGKHVVVDKPLGISVKQTGDMLRLAVEKRLAHAITYNHRFLPLVFHMREMVRRGDLGKITLIKAHTLGDFMMAINEIAPGHWRTNPETVGLSKTMSTMGGHLLDLLYFISGLRARSVFADFVYVDPKTPPIGFDGEDFVPGTTGQMEDHVNLLLRFDDGVKGSVVLSEAAPGHKVDLFLEIMARRVA
jgi:predicted dehydrogenase